MCAFARWCLLDIRHAQEDNQSPVQELTDQNWVAVKELNISYYVGETILLTIYSPYGNLI